MCAQPASRGELEVVNINFASRAQRRLRRHARAAISLQHTEPLIVDDDCVDVEAARSRAIHADVIEAASVEEQPTINAVDVSSDEDSALPAHDRSERTIANPARNLAAREPSSARSRYSEDSGARPETASEWVTRTRSAASSSLWSSQPWRNRVAARQHSAFSSDPNVPRLPSVFQVPLSEEPAAPPHRLRVAGVNMDFVDGEMVSASSSSSNASRAVVPNATSPVGANEMAVQEFLNFNTEIEDLPASSHLDEDLRMDIDSPRPEVGQFFVEHMRNGMEPRHCSVCHSPFIVGQLRLGFATTVAEADTTTMSRALPRWAHAPRCVEHVDVSFRLGIERVSFNNTVALSDRDRLLQALVSLARRRPSSRQRLLHWDYAPARIQRWASVVIHDLRGLRRPVTPSSSVLAARAALRGARPPRPDYDQTPVLSPALAEVPGDAVADAAQQVLAQLLIEGAIRAAAVHDEFIASTPSVSSVELESMLRDVPVCTLDRPAPEPCAVCREPMRRNDSCRRLPCLHLFHRECIDPWLRIKASCPLDKLLLVDLLGKQRQILTGHVPELEDGNGSNIRSLESLDLARTASQQQSHERSRAYSRTPSRSQSRLPSRTPSPRHRSRSRHRADFSSQVHHQTSWR